MVKQISKSYMVRTAMSFFYFSILDVPPKVRQGKIRRRVWEAAPYFPNPELRSSNERRG